MYGAHVKATEDQTKKNCHVVIPAASFYQARTGARTDHTTSLSSTFKEAKARRSHSSRRLKKGTSDNADEDTEDNEHGDTGFEDSRWLSKEDISSKHSC